MDDGAKNLLLIRGLEFFVPVVGQDVNNRLIKKRPTGTKNKDQAIIFPVTHGQLLFLFYVYGREESHERLRPYPRVDEETMRAGHLSRSLLCCGLVSSFKGFHLFIRPGQQKRDLEMTVYLAGVVSTFPFSSSSFI